MRLVLILSFIVMLFMTNAQAQYGYCFDNSYMDWEEVDSVTSIWFEDVELCPYGDTWHEIIAYCHDESQLQKFTLQVGDTLKLLLGYEPTIIIASVKRSKGNYVYGTSYPNECLTGSNDFKCFEEYTEPIPIIPIIGSFTLESNCITVNMPTGIVFWDILDPMEIKVADIDPNEPYCINTNTCFYLVYQDGTSSQIHCI